MSESDEFTRLNNAYHTAIELWKLASDQIYTRFSAMLTANSIILAVIGLSITERINIPSWFVWVLIGAGIALCLVWIYFMAQGVRVENYYRRKAETLESKVVPDGEKIFLNKGDTGYIKAGRIHDAKYVEDCKLVYVHDKAFGFSAEA